MTTQSNIRSPQLEDVIQAAVEYYLEDVHTALPARVLEFNPDDQSADVQPLVQRLVETEDEVELLESFPVLPNVPIMFPRAQKFMVTFPIDRGDIVLLIFTERSIDKWLAGDGDETNPNDFLRHDLSSAIAIPGIYPFRKAIQNYDPEALTIGVDGSTIVRVKEDLIELGKKDSGDKASLDSKVQNELARIKTELDNVKTIFDSHVHPGVTAGPASTGSTLTPILPAPANPGATASALVTIEK